MNNDVHPYFAPFVLDAWMGWTVWCLPVTFGTQVESYSDQSVVCGQPRARVQIVHVYSPIHCVLVTPSRRCSYLQLGGPQVSSYTQIAPVGLPFEQIVLRVACVWEAAGFDR